VARLAEAFHEFGANIVRLNSERIPGTAGAQYVTRISVWIPEAKADACLATVANTAAQMKLTFRVTSA
jgi:glycine cleavage system transcriptional repressor